MKGKFFIFAALALMVFGGYTLVFSGFGVLDRKIFSEEATKQIANAAQPTGLECVDPVWDMPRGAATIRLSQNEITPGQKEVTGVVTVNDLGRWFKTENLSRLGPLKLILQIETPKVVRFPGGNTFMEHIVDPSLIANDGTYNFNFQLNGRQPGVISLALRWKWTILTEGACSVAINGVYAGCTIGGALNAACVCATLGAMPAPGSWACSVHPLTFRAAWALWGCAGPSPY